MTTTPTAILDQLAAIHTHLTDFELPAVASVHVAASTAAQQQVSVQLACPEPSELAHGLLAWADTLTQVTARAWRVPQGDSVQLSVTGLLPHGVSVEVYGGLWEAYHGPGADLPPGATTTIPLNALRHTATTRETSTR